MPSAGTLSVNSAKCQDEQCFLDFNLVALVHSVKEVSITFTDFPPSVIGTISVPLIVQSHDIHALRSFDDIPIEKSLFHLY